MLQDTHDLIVGLLTENDGAMAYSDLLELIPFPNRPWIPKVFDYAKSIGTINREVRYVAGEGTRFTISLPEA